MTAIEIVSYDGENPNLCFGRLKLKADGKEYVTSPGVLFPGEGAECYCDENWGEVIERGRWRVDPTALPEEIRHLASRIGSAVNESDIGRLCYGGCIRGIPVGKIIRRRVWQWEI